MRRTRSTRRPIAVVLAMSLATALLAILWTGTAWGACGSNLDLALAQSASPGSGGDIVYSFTVTNYGPSCAHGVKLHADLGSGFVSFTSSDSWVCPAPPGSLAVDCALQTDLNEGSSSSLSIEVAPPTPSNSKARGSVSADATSDPDPSNNVGWGGFGKQISTDPQGPNSQTTTISRPDPASISAQEVSPGSRQGSGVPAPCEPKCLGSLETIFTTPATDPSKFPDVHIAIILGVKTSQTNTNVPIYRFDDDKHVWIGPLPSCSGGGPIDPNVGCVKSVVIAKGTATITIWTSHNGHIRG